MRKMGQTDKYALNKTPENWKYTNMIITWLLHCTYVDLAVERAQEVGDGGRLGGSGLADEQHGPLDADLQTQEPLGARRVDGRNEDLVELALRVVLVLGNQTRPRAPLFVDVVVEGVEQRLDFLGQLTCNTHIHSSSKYQGYM